MRPKFPQLLVAKDAELIGSVKYTSVVSDGARCQGFFSNRAVDILEASKGTECGPSSCHCQQPVPGRQVQVLRPKNEIAHSQQVPGKQALLQCLYKPDCPWRNCQVIRVVAWGQRSKFQFFLFPNAFLSSCIRWKRKNQGRDDL